MKKLFTSLAAAMSVLLFSQTVTARDFADIYTECGLGAMIAPNNTAVAAVTNVTWDLGTTAVSSNISSPETCKGGQPKKAAFIHETYPKIAQDIARGSGTHLNTLISMSGCNAGVQHNLATAVRVDFAQIVASPKYVEQSRFEKAKILFEAVNQRIERDFSAHCSIT
jgi:hypothetical protein